MVIYANVQSSMGGCGNQEDMPHLFLHCDYFRQLWIDFYDWLGFVVITPYYLSDHLSQFSVLGGFSKYKRSLLRLIWFSTV